MPDQSPIPSLQSAALTAPHVLEYPYTRSTGDVIGRFFAGLKQRQITGIRTADGRLLCPPLEYDPETGESLLQGEWVDLPDTGLVTTWTWIEQPRAKHPLQRPFAYALVRIDGADTGMLHAVTAPGAEAMASGMRVRAKWRDDRTGDITDIEYFEPAP